MQEHHPVFAAVRIFNIRSKMFCFSNISREETLVKLVGPRDL